MAPAQRTVGHHSKHYRRKKEGETCPLKTAQASLSGIGDWGSGPTLRPGIRRIYPQGRGKELGTGANVRKAMQHITVEPQPRGHRRRCHCCLTGCLR